MKIKKLLHSKVPKGIFIFKYFLWDVLNLYFTVWYWFVNAIHHFYINVKTALGICWCLFCPFWDRFSCRSGVRISVCASFIFAFFLLEVCEGFLFHVMSYAGVGGTPKELSPVWAQLCEPINLLSALCRQTWSRLHPKHTSHPVTRCLTR